MAEEPKATTDPRTLFEQGKQEIYQRMGRNTTSARTLDQIAALHRQLYPNDRDTTAADFIGPEYVPEPGNREYGTGVIPGKLSTQQNWRI